MRAFIAAEFEIYAFSLVKGSVTNPTPFEVRELPDTPGT